MKTRIDLHSHSIASDGTLTPAELIQRASAAGVEVLALTDHDTLAGIAEARRAARDYGLQLVAGVEISVIWNKRTIHVLGLNVDVENKALLKGLEGLRTFREWRAKEIAHRLEKAGIPGAYEGACRYATGELISRTHFARFLVDEGRAKTVRDVFKRYLVSGKPGHVPGQWIDMNSAIGWIKDAGGQAVLAHPARYKLTRTKMIALLSDFHEAGGEAIEVVSGSHSRDDCFKMAKFAQEFNFKASAGSDFHSPDNKWTDVGRLAELPEQCLPIWSDWPIFDQAS